jgi:hypothetical protein
MLSEIYLILGLFCMHHVKAFTQLHIKKIPNAYGTPAMPDLSLSGIEMTCQRMGKTEIEQI